MTKGTKDKLTRARSVLVMSQPFFGCLALHLKMVESEDYSTMATDGKVLYWNTNFVEELNKKELIGVLAHEVLHCAYRHHTRRQKRNPKGWNIATDYAINRDLFANGFVLPDGALHDAKYDGMSAEEIYSTFDEQKKGGQDGQKGAKGGKNDSDPGGCGQIIDAAPEHDAGAVQQANADWQAKVRQALSVAKAGNIGKLPGVLGKLATETVAPIIDWRTELRRFIDQSNVKDYSFMRPNRRFIGQGIIMPGFISDSLAHLVLVIDTSGSIDHKVLSAFTAEAGAALSEGAADKITVIHCDRKVHAVEEFQPGDELTIKPQGGGGTDFRPAFDWINENAQDASAVVYFTDLQTHHHGEEPNAPVLWAGCGQKRSLAHWFGLAPFGELIALAD